MHNNKKNHSTTKNPTCSGRRLVTAFFCSAGLALAGTAAQADNDPIEVKVYFDADRCPTAVDKELVLIDYSNPKKILWLAYDMDNKRIEDIEFDIFFDPFVGPDPKSKKKKGTVESPVIKKGIPLDANYKYTILATGCEKGYDPVIRVR